MKRHSKLLPYLRPYRLQLAGVILFAVGATGMSFTRRRSSLLVFGKLQKPYVLEVYLPTGGALGEDEVFARDDVEPLPAVLHLDAASVGFIEGQSRRLGLDVYADPILKYRDLVREQIFDRSERGGGEPGLIEGVKQPPGVIFGRFDEDVEVESSAGNPMEHRGDTTDDDILNPMLLKGREYTREPV